MRTRGGLYVPEAGGPGLGDVVAGYGRDGRPLPVIRGGAVSAAAMRQQQGNGQGRPGGGQAVPLVPFVRGSREFAEGPFTDQSITPGAAQQAAARVNVPARGWATHLAIQVDMSGGVLGAGVLHEDWPFNIFANLALSRPNGSAFYFGPLAGYSGLQANIYGGYAFESDPRTDPQFDGSINANFIIYIPLEITHHDAYGALINQDSGAQYQLSWNVPASATAFATVPTTAPAVRFRAWLEGWEQPNPMDLLQRPIEQMPPGTPTAQFWTEQTFDVVNGLNTIRLTDVGNLYRVLVAIARTTAPARSDAILGADSIRFAVGGRDIFDRSLALWRRHMFERYGVGADTGVLVLDNIHDGEGHAGEETRSQYLPTSDATRVELIFTAGAAGTLTVLTNDVAPGSLSPAPATQG